MLSPTERAMLLLCADFDDGQKPVGVREFRELSKKALAFELFDPSRDVVPSDFVNLGYDFHEAQRLYSLLNRENKLDTLLGRLGKCGIWPLTRISVDYPRALLKKLGDSAPTVLFCAGNRLLLNLPAVALVGSRRISQSGESFAKAVGKAAAEEGLCLVSGGAAGADKAGENGALTHGGAVISFVAQPLYQTAKKLSSEIDEGKLLLITAGGPFVRFSAAVAQSRNRLIHSYCGRVFVAGADFESGGSWSGTADNLSHNRSDVFVFDDGTRGCNGLVSMGATPLALADVHDLLSIPVNRPVQQTLF